MLPRKEQILFLLLKTPDILTSTECLLVSGEHSAFEMKHLGQVIVIGLVQYFNYCLQLRFYLVHVFHFLNSYPAAWLVSSGVLLSHSSSPTLFHRLFSFFLFFSFPHFLSFFLSLPLSFSPTPPRSLSMYTASNVVFVSFTRLTQKAIDSLY